MNFDIIQKILQKKGGYPNEILKTIMQVINLTKYEFLKSMVDKFGKEGAEQFIQQSLRNMSKQGKIRINAGNLSAPGYEKDSFIELSDEVKSVLCCRVSPKQKAEIVKLV